MERQMKDYSSLLKQTAQYEDEAVASMFDCEAGRAEYILQITNKSPLRRRYNRLSWVTVAIGVLVLGALSVWFWGMSDPAFSPKPQWIQVAQGDSQVLRFADGTSVRFPENSAGRISQTASHQGEVTLESGRVSLKVTHTDQTDWHVLAGPYSVAVTGTAFEVTWNPQLEKFRVNVFEGSVLVTGPMVENGHTVTKQRSLVADVATTHVEMQKLDDTTVSPRATSLEVVPLKSKTGSSDSEKTSQIDVVTNKRPEKKLAAKPRTIDWLNEATSGNYARIAARIESVGLNQILHGAAPSHYLTLGNAARLARDEIVAERVYTKLRQNYPHSGHASTAALYLGRMAFDQQRKYAKAAKWFDTYLNEQKNGTLHRETMGRLMEAQHKAKMTANAKNTAKQYLEQYADGPHAPRAKMLLGQ